MSLSNERFVEWLGRLGIVSETEAGTLAGTIAAEQRAADADPLARDLVRQGKLTRYQAAAIYQQKAEGLLLGNYLILDKLGAGGMGQVFRARHRRMDRIVALKVLSKKTVGSADAIARFQREVKAAARLTHPNIVTAFDADEAGGTHFLVMEYVEGSDLASLVKAHGPLKPEQALDCIAQAARGLEHAHAEGVVHRDIKPSNLLLDKRGTVKILDMGLARMDDPLAEPGHETAGGEQLTHSGSIMGSIDYMAPEQAMDSRQADARSDVYGLGCTLHYLLTGRPPYGGDTVMKRLTAHQGSAIPHLASPHGEVPPAMQELFSRMMAKSPAGRYQSMADVLAAIEAGSSRTSRPKPISIDASVLRPAAVGTAPLAELESVILPGRKPRARSGRNRSRLPLAAAALLLIATGAGIVVWLRATPSNEQPVVAQAEPAAAIATVDDQPSPDQTAAPSKESAPAGEAPKAGSPVPMEPAADPATPPLPMPAAPPALPAQSPLPVTVPPGEPPPATLPQVENTAAATSSPTTDMPAAGTPASPAAPSAAPAVVTEPPAAVAATVPPPAAAPPAADSDPRSEVPGGSEIERARELITDIFKSDYAAAKQPDEKLALANKLVDQAGRTRDDPAGRYVMLDEARRLAAEAGDPVVVERTSSRLADAYKVDLAELLASGWTETLRKSRSPEASRKLAELAAARLNQAADEDRFDEARQFQELTLAAAKKTKDAALVKQTVEQGKSLAAREQQVAARKKLLATLQETPDDPQSNLALGRLLLVDDGAPPEAWAYLAKSDDETLKPLAERSLAASQGAPQQAELGDAWWDAAERAKGKEKAPLAAGARYWYEQALPGLSGLARTRVEKRLAEVAGPKPRPSSRSLAATQTPANGFWLPETLDCSVRSYPVALGPGFDIRQSWTLAFEFRPRDFSDKGKIFFWGDQRAGRDPLYIQQSGDELLANVADSETNQRHELRFRLPPQLAGQWIRVAFSYDAPRNEASLRINGDLVRSETSTVRPNADRPMKLFIGGIHGNAERYHGAVRGVWLGNQAAAVALATNSAGPRPGTRSRIGSTSQSKTPGMPQPEVEREFAKWVFSLGGQVAFEIAPNGMPTYVTSADQMPPDPLMVRAFNLDSNQQVTDSDIARVDRLGSLVEAQLWGTNVGDEALEHLSHVATLRHLRMGRTRVTDGGLVVLEKMPGLVKLILDTTSLTDAGMVHLRPLVNIESLGLQNVHISDAALGHFGAMRKLWLFFAGGSRITDDGMRMLAQFPHLTHLGLAGTRITDASIPLFQRMPKLGYLYIGGTQITDAGLAGLAQMPGLSVLNLGGLSVSPTRLAQLRTALPNCKITE